MQETSGYLSEHVGTKSWPATRVPKDRDMGALRLCSCWQNYRLYNSFVLHRLLRYIIYIYNICIFRTSVSFKCMPIVLGRVILDLHLSRGVCSAGCVL